MDNVKEINLDKTKESYRSQRKKYKAEIKEIQEFYHPKKFRKHDIHKEWKDDWKGYIECTYPWDGNNVFVTLVYNLEILRANLRQFGNHVDQDQEIIEMDEVIALGRKIIDFDYDNGAYKFLKDHTTNYALVYRKLSPDPKDMKTGELIAKIVMPRDDSMNFKHIVDKKYTSPLNKYLKDNNLKEWKDVSVSYTGEWDDMTNYDVWQKMLKDATKQREADKKKFYSILCKKLEHWWD